MVKPPVRPGAALVKAGKKKRPKRPAQQLSTPPVARGNTITGASTSTTRIGY